MGVELIFAPSAYKELSKFRKEIAQRIFKKCQKTKGDPLAFWVKITDKDFYKLRIGEYRVIADINLEDGCIEVIKVGHRKNIYKQI